MKYLLFFPVLICFLGCRTTEIPNKIVEIDFSNPTYPPVLSLKPRQTLEIKLKNMNPYLFEIITKDSLIVYRGAQPALFSQVFKLPELSGVSTESPPASDSGASSLPNIGKETYTPSDTSELSMRLKSFISEYSGIQVSVAKILDHSKIPVELEKLLKDCVFDQSKLDTLVSSYIADKLNLESSTLPIGIQNEIERISKEAKGGIEKHIVTGEKLMQSYEQILESTNPDIKIVEYKKLDRFVKEKISIIDKVIENTKKLQKSLIAFDEANVGISIEENYKKLLVSRIEKSILVPTFYSTDELNINIGVKKKNGGYCPNDISSIPITAIIKGGIKIDFSTGLVLNVGRNTIFNEKYYYDSFYRFDNSLADSVVIKRSQNSNLVIPSIGAFLHVYSRSLSQLNVGGTIGTSLGSDQRTYFHLGGCILVGKSDRLIIGGGLSIASREMLDGKYFENQVISRKLAPTVIPTEDATRIGGYLSVTWNLNLIK